MNLYEIRLFQGVMGFDVFLKVPVIIIIRFSGNVLGIIYIDILYTPYIYLFIIHKNLKKYKSMTYAKIKFYIIFVQRIFFMMNNKEVTKR